MEKGIEIKVADNGNGIPEKIKDKIFQPFFATILTGERTGLGLNLSYDMVKANGGEIIVNTKADKGNPDNFQKVEGCEFVIHLPLV